MLNNQKNIHTVEQLAQNGLIPNEKIPELNAVAQQFSISITSQISELLLPDYPEDPINLQFIPTEKELEFQSFESEDPIGDHTYSPIPGIVHRHPDRCLLKPINSCPVYCRFCFRREQIGHQKKVLDNTALETAYEYIAKHPEIWEVIITGGDPLMLNPQQLANILSRLSKIKTVEVIRIHTRIPVVDSKRINSEMLEALSIEKALFIVLHANHPREFTDAACAAIHKIIRAGIPMLSQSVLLKGINDTVETLQALLKLFVKNRIKPYYLHHCDLAKGTDHFRTSITEGQHLMRALRGLISGVCQPTYVLDIPGGHGKIPLHPTYLKVQQTENTTAQDTAHVRDTIQACPEHYIVEDHFGNKHLYPPKKEGV